MKLIAVKVNLRDVNITQFDSLREAFDTLPKALILHWLNLNWRTTQMHTIVSAMRKEK